MITKVSYRPYTSSANSVQNQPQNVNFGTKLDQNTLQVGRNFAHDLINLTQSREPVTRMTQLLKHLDSQAAETMTVKELVAAARESGLIPPISG